MGAVDPFSAASKPMPDWDSPSQPLQFAATLHTLDLNAPSTPRLPRPRPLRHYEELSKISPTSSYRYAGHANQLTSISSGVEVELSPSRTPRGLNVGSDAWMESKVAECVDNAKPDLDLSNFGLEFVSSNIGDMRNVVILSNKSPVQLLVPQRPLVPLPPLPETPVQQLRQPLGLGERSFARTHSAPASAVGFSQLNGTYSPGLGSSSGSLPAVQQNSSTGRTLTRSKTGAVSLTRTQPDIAINLSKNRLTSLPTVLLEIRNLTVLCLFNNQLRSLPAAIGNLIHLKELSISNNLIEWLPSTILDLESLELFRPFPNPWLERPTIGCEATYPTGRVLGPLRSFQEGSVQRLDSLCLTILLSPRSQADPPPFMYYNWDAHYIRGKHPLLDVEGLHREMLPEIPVGKLKRILQAAKSGCDSGAGQLRRSIRATASDTFPSSHGVPPPDDASTNMYYSPCPSIRHEECDAGSGEQPLYPRVFLDPAEERFEWAEVAGVKELPIRWLGCSPGCLAFLEQGEATWGVDGFDDEPAWW